MHLSENNEIALDNAKGGAHAQTDSSNWAIFCVLKDFCDELGKFDAESFCASNFGRS